MDGKSIIETMLETAQDCGLSKKTMRELEALNLPVVKEYSPKEIRAFREREMVSQAVMARYLNVTPSTIHKWENGEVRPRYAALRLLNLVIASGLEVIYPRNTKQPRVT